MSISFFLSSVSFSPQSSSFPLNTNPNFLDQQPSNIDTVFDNDTVKAAQNILALLQETQFAADTEVSYRREKTRIHENIVFLV